MLLAVLAWCLGCMPSSSPRHATTTVPSGPHVDLVGLARKLTAQVGGKWSIRRADDINAELLYGVFPVSDALSTMYVVFPFRADGRRADLMSAFRDVRSRPFRMLGSNDRMAVLVGPVTGKGEPAESPRVMQVLGLRPPASPAGGD